MQQTFQCTKCGSQNYPGTSFCWNCGNKLSGGAKKVGDNSKGLKTGALVCGLIVCFMLIFVSLGAIGMVANFNFDDPKADIKSLVLGLILMFATILSILGVSFVSINPRLSVLFMLIAMLCAIPIVSLTGLKAVAIVAIPFILLLTSAILAYLAGKDSY